MNRTYLPRRRRRRAALRSATCLLLAWSVFLAGCVDKTPVAAPQPAAAPPAGPPATPVAFSPADARLEVEKRRAELARVEPAARDITDLRAHPAARPETPAQLKTRWVAATGKSWAQMTDAVDKLKADGPGTAAAVAAPDPGRCSPPSTPTTPGPTRRSGRRTGGRARRSAGSTAPSPRSARPRPSWPRWSSRRPARRRP